MAVTEHVVPAFPFAVSVSPETVQLPVAENVRAPDPEPPEVVNGSVEPKEIDEEDETMSVA